MLLGGCITLLETTLGTPWEFDTRGAILLLEDRGVKPYQLDRMLLHLRRPGNFAACAALSWAISPIPSRRSESGSPSVRDVCRRILMPLRMPMIFGAAIGHTVRPMLTIPFGVRARLRRRRGQLEILEPVVSPRK